MQKPTYNCNSVTNSHYKYILTKQDNEHSSRLWAAYSPWSATKSMPPDSNITKIAKKKAWLRLKLDCDKTESKPK